ncbi:MAG TPA: elongation factor Ts [Firmicutes bacterium]|jgi:elongation factor Ts|nr:elongation factor Ts [Bacillota bacterium]
MAEVTAAVVKELRERTGAGMMDCKKALAETGGELEKAIEYLREKGLAAAAKKAGRIAAEGMVNAYISADKKVGVLVEVNCETDFAAKNVEFQKFAKDVAELVAAKAPADLAALSQMTLAAGKTVTETINAMVSTIGENIQLRRFVRFELKENGVIDSYIHMGGRIGVLIECATAKADTGKNSEFLTLIKDLAMQVAAAKPEYVRRDEVPADVLEHEKAIYKAQAMNEGKPEAIAEKIMTGRLEKFYKEVCLVEQLFIKDTEQTVTKLIQTANAKLGGENIVVTRFARYEKGEGIEKKKDDFASEVMSQIKA